MEKGKKGKSRSKTQRDTKLPYQAKMNSAYQHHSFKKQLEHAFMNCKRFSNEPSGMELHDKPFQCCVMPNLIKDSQFLEGLKFELLDQIFIDKNNDLYKFQQTDDLKKISTPHVKLLRKFLAEDMLDWLRDVTGIQLTDQIDATCSRYDYTDALLCHDDELSTRRIAFILYLVPPWKPQDGGSLDLYDMDEHCQPRNVVKSIYPAWNQFSWFEVSEASHHQVSEVLSEDKTRLSVNGWFHGPVVPRAERYREPAMPLLQQVHVEQDTFLAWINPIYLESDVQCGIQAKFERESEIELQGFIQDDKYKQLMEALRNDNVEWTEKGPPNKRCYGVLNESHRPAVIEECLRVFRSEAMFLTLSNLTGLSLHPLAVSHESDSESDDASFTSDGLPSNKDYSDQDTDDQPDSTTDSDKAKPSRKRRRLNNGCERSKPENDDRPNSMEEEDSPKSPPESTATCSCEIRKWGKGSYTLVHDTDPHRAEKALDAVLFCACKGWKQEYGGFTSYIASGENEELLSVHPAKNSLALVYRDEETLKFVKHINNRIFEMASPQPTFYDVAFTYYE